MPGINNISNVNNLDSKRVVSKLSFQVGEVFEAKVVEVKDQGNEVVLKTADAWQFTANAKIPLDNLPKGLVKFKVVGYEDGKLQIVIVSDKVEGTSDQEKSIQMILKQQNLSLSKADLEILKSMVSHGIPLTKENISAVKTIIDFKEKVSVNIEEEDTFINKYLQSKGIEVNSVQGKNINQLLKAFFSELKKTSIEDLVTLKENGIEFTEDNLKSFNRVFKEDTGLYKKITENINKETLIDKGAINTSINSEKISGTDFKAVGSIKASSQEENNVKLEEGNVDFKELNISSNNKGDTLLNIKSETTKSFLDAIIQDDGIKDNLVLKEQQQNPMKINDFVYKDTQEHKITQNMLESDIPVTKENISIVKTIIDLKEEILLKPKNESEVIKQYLNSKNIPEDSQKGKELNNSIKEFFELIKTEPIKEVLAKLQPSSEVKTEGADVKNFDEQFKENLPAFKEIIKSIFKGNEIVKGIEINKGSQLAENIKSEIAQKTNFMKDVIKSMSDGDWSLIKSSINDIKVFNTVSNQYYYMDLPVNINQKQYECKLLIKDDRKKGKKIDSKNVKMFLSVKTINMGKVDAYIKVSERNVTIDLKCSENFIKVLENENYKLVSILQDMNYNVSLKIEKQGYEANIVTTREFFQDSAIGSINVMV